MTGTTGWGISEFCELFEHPYSENMIIKKT
jgi:hypothetical protein